MSVPVYVVTARFSKGRYLVRREGGHYVGQRILNVRQKRHGNTPDHTTGFYLHESARWFSPEELLTIVPFRR